MKLSAIPPVLLMLLFFSAGCDRNDLPDDPWLEMYGSYAGTSEIYVPGSTGAQDEILSDWMLKEELHPDTVHLMPGECSDPMEAAPGCIRIHWKSSCRSGEECHEIRLNLLSQQKMASARKSNRMILYIPRGEIYPGSDYSISAGQAYQAAGLEFLEGNGLYLFDLELNNRDDDPCLLMIFTGRKLPETVGFSGHAGRGNAFRSSEKHYPANITP